LSAPTVISKAFLTSAGILLFALVEIVRGQTLPTSAENTILDNTTIFSDGIYLSREAFLTNKPEIQWGGDPAVFLNPQTLILKADYWILGSGDTLFADQAYALAVDGKPYLRIPEIESLLEAFVPLKVRGRICHYSYPVVREQSVEVAAYNPLTGKPFRRGTVINEEDETEHWIFHFLTGERKLLTRESLMEWVSDDPALVKAIKELEDDQNSIEKLIKSLKIYDDRHPVMLPPQ